MVLIFVGVGFFLNGRVLPNDSIVNDIGESSNALYCLTDRVQCCSPEAGGNHGLWRFPNGATVGIYSTADFYFSRGFSSLLLNRRSSAVGPTGVYTCTIPDTVNVMRLLRIAIYRTSSGGKFLFLGGVVVGGVGDVNIYILLLPPPPPLPNFGQL